MPPPSGAALLPYTVYATDSRSQCSHEATKTVRFGSCHDHHSGPIETAMGGTALRPKTSGNPVTVEDDVKQIASAESTGAPAGSSGCNGRVADRWRSMLFKPLNAR